MSTTQDISASRRPRIGPTWRAVSVRLRFPLVLLAAFLVAAQWEVIRGYWDRFTRASIGVESGMRAVSGDTEYFCPMDPGVISDWPSKCGVCHMALVRRKKGDMAPLPEGVVARMQFSPYRLQLAGIQTASVGYRPLARTIEAVGAVEAEGIEAEVVGRDALLVAEGQPADVEAIDDGAKSEAKVASVEDRPDSALPTVLVRLTSDARNRAGRKVVVRFRVPMADVEPFRSQPSDPPPAGAKAVYRCHEHPSVIELKSGRCPIGGNALMRHALTAHQRVGWWCPMHPRVVASEPGRKCLACGGMVLVPRLVAFRPKGQVLVVPESAVVDTGSRRLVYVERMPGTFDGVEVVIGPRCEDAYPVASGLEEGDRVATAGSFLIDAETRLNPSVAASYFGSARRESKAEAGSPLDDLPPADRALAARQKTCPVTGKPLGSMGTPTRVEVKGRAVLLCCEGCEEALTSDPAKYLSKLPAEAKTAP